MTLKQKMDPLLLEQTLDCSNICIFDEKFSIYYSNINFYSLLGYKENDLNGKSILQLKHLPEPSPTYNFLIQTLERGEVWKGELQFHHKNNMPIYLDATIKPVQIKGQPVRYIATFLDIHHRKQLIDNLKRRAHQQGLISILGQISLNNIPINDLLQQTLSVICSSFNVTTGMILEISVNGEKALVRTAYNTSIVRQGSSVLTIDDDNILGYTLRSDRPVICDSYENERRFTLPDTFIKEDSKSAICALIGERKYPFGIFVLLTKKTKTLNIDEIHFLQSVCNILAEAINRKNMEKALRYEQELSRKYLDVAEVIFIVLDENEKILLANLHAASVLGYSQQDLSGLSFFDTFKSDETKESSKEEFHKIFMNKKIKQKQKHTNIHGNISPIINKKNITRFIKWKSSALHNEEGDVNAILYAGEDITDLLAHEKEQKHLEKQLSQAQKMEAIGMLAGGIAHDFNNILVSILGFSDLAFEVLKNDTKNINSVKLNQYLTQIKNSGLKARDIIAQIQNIDQQDETPNKSILLPSLLKGTLKMLRSALPSSMDIKVNIRNEVPAVNVNASKFNQMVMHLLTNARNSVNRQGKINISLSLISFTNEICSACNNPVNNDYVVFCVSDNGPGFTDKNIYELFNNSSSGLSLVSKLVHDSNGHMIISDNNFSTSPATGSTVQILFKIANITKEKIETEKNMIDISAMHGKHLMIVDDENTVATYMGELFRSAGFKVSVFCDSIEALEEFKNQANDYDLIITDLTMPALTGDLLSIEILDIQPDMPIIICTGQSDSFTQENAANINIQGFLKKPIHSAELLHAVVSLLSATSR